MLQVRAASVGGRMDRAMCRDSSLVTDPWLIFDRSTLGHQRVGCPLHGGYSVHLFDKVDDAAPGYLPKPRSKAENQPLYLFYVADEGHRHVCLMDWR